MTQPGRMLPLLLLEDGDFRIPIADLNNYYLQAQVSWFRSWFKPFGSKDIDTVSAEQEAELASLLKGTEDCLAKAKPDYDDHALLEDAVQALTERFKEARKQFIILRTTPKPAGQTHGGRAMAIKASQKSLLAIQDELKAAKITRNNHKKVLEPWEFSLELFRQDRVIVEGIQTKLTRMRAVETEYKSRNKLAKAIADYRAWSTNTESTWVEPVLPEYIHSTTFLSGDSDAMVFEGYTADLSMAYGAAGVGGAEGSGFDIGSAMEAALAW